MLSPEVWSFKPPQHHISTYKGSETAHKKILQDIGCHFFNHGVTVVLPDTVLIPEDLNLALTKDSVYYKIHQLPIRKFLDKQFIESFVKAGQIFALSVGTWLDTDDCAAVTPTGHLVLNLIKQTYQSLGLEGKASQFCTERYVVTIDLKDPTLSSGKKKYDRVLRCLSECVDITMDMLIAWEPPATGDGEVCPSSVAAYLSRAGCEVSSCRPRARSGRHYCVQLPAVSATCPDQLLEWLGAVALDVDLKCSDAESLYLSRYQGPLDTTGESQVATLHHQGFFTTGQIFSLYNSLSKYVENRADMPWAVLHIQGFADSPVSWGLQEHSFLSDGDNNCTILLHSDKTFLLFKTISFSRKKKFK